MADPCLVFQLYAQCNADVPELISQYCVPGMQPCALVCSWSKQVQHFTPLVCSWSKQVQHFTPVDVDTRTSSQRSRVLCHAVADLCLVFQLYVLY